MNKKVQKHLEIIKQDLFKNELGQNIFVQYLESLFIIDSKQILIEWETKCDINYEKQGFIIESKQHAKIYFYTSEKEQFDNWCQIFFRKINIRNFHNVYKAEAKLGSGGFAQVYLANNNVDNKQYAIKAFSKKSTFKDEEAKQALFNEIECHRNMDCDYVIRLYAIYETDNSIYFVMNYIQHGNLHSLVKKQQIAFTESQKMSLIYSLLKGIYHMHKRGYMHRDLKPENILIQNEKCTRVVIADMGLATKISLNSFLFTRCGTPGYVAPEVINIVNLKSTYGEACDIYSAGLIFHILLTGENPFGGKNYNEVLSKNKAALIDFTKVSYKKISSKALDLLQQMLNRNPNSRISAFQCLQHDYFDPINRNGDNTQKNTSYYTPQKDQKVNTSPVKEYKFFKQSTLQPHSNKENPQTNKRQTTKITKKIPSSTTNNNTIQRKPVFKNLWN